MLSNLWDLTLKFETVKSGSALKTDLHGENYIPME